MSVSSGEHACDTDCEALHQCRTLDDVLTVDMEHTRKVNPLHPSVAPIYRHGFWAGASAVVGLMEANDVSIVAIQAMIQLEAERRQNVHDEPHK